MALQSHLLLRLDIFVSTGAWARILLFLLLSDLRDIDAE